MARGWFGSDDVRRWWLSARCAPGALKDYYRVDTPTEDTPWTRAEFAAIDLETTGLDPDVDDIVSIGLVPIVGGRVVLSGALRRLVRPTRPVGERAAAVHGLLDDVLAAAAPLEEVMPEVLAALTGRLPVAHHAKVEREFLTRACRRLYGRPLEVPYLDTMDLERRLLGRSDTPLAEGMLRLDACRSRRGLPRYRPHDALTDALACAELFLVQATMLGGAKPAQLRDLLN